MVVHFVVHVIIKQKWGVMIKMDKKIIAIIILSLIILGGIGVYGYNKITEKAYVKGYNQAQVDIIIKINTEGVIPVLYQEGEETKINWIEINQGS